VAQTGNKWERGGEQRNWFFETPSPEQSERAGAAGFGVGSARLPPPTFGTQQEQPKLPRVTAPPPFRLPMEQVLPGHHITAEDPVRLSRNNGWNAQTSYSKSAPGGWHAA
jgi:hypothetical protein